MKLFVDIKELNVTSSGGKSLILKDISFELGEGNIYVILGKNGSGKSTLIKSFAALLDNRFYELKGSIIADGKDILSMNTKELLLFRREKIKYVLQDSINSFDPLRKIGYYFTRLNLEGKDLDNSLEYFLLPGYNVINKMYSWQLSGGMAQRLSLVIALSMKPQLLILDEPTSGIDAAITNLVLLKISEYVKHTNNSVLLVTQDLSFAEKAGDFISHINNKTMTPFKSTEEYLAWEERLFRV